MNYSPQLNVKSAYNFQESLITIDDYLEFAKANNFKFAFYNDVNTMYGAAEFFTKFSQANIKPIIGLTVEIELNQKISLAMYAKNQAGFQKLSYLSSQLSSKNFDQDPVEKISLTKSCLSNDLVLVISFENEVDQNFVDNFCCSFDQRFLYLGINQNNQSKIKTENVVYTNLIAYLSGEDQLAYNVLLAIKENVKVDLTKTLIDHHYLTDDELLKSSLSNQNLMSIADAVDFDLFADNHQHLMEFQTENNLSQQQLIDELTSMALKKYFASQNLNQDLMVRYVERLNYELGIIQEMNFTNYFLVVWDYVKFAKEQKIMVGPGRGSAAGSLVAFLLGITEVDPIKYNLLFERFLNPERKSMPDIDLDFQDDRREEVLQYLFNKYGTYHVATIVTYQTIGAKYALRDVFRAFDKSFETVNKITKLIRYEFQTDLVGAIKSSHALQAYYENNQQEFEVALKIIGLPRQTGTHAAGVILSDVDLRTVLPIRLGYNGIMQTQFDMNYLEALGLIKMDLLGLKNLSILQEIKHSVFQAYNKVIDFQKIPLDDLKVFQQLNEGKTTGIFQLESPGMTELVTKMQVQSIEDISAASALFRPGPKEMIPTYLKRRQSSKKLNQYIIDPSLSEILNSSYGVVLYQEQVLLVLQKVANFNLAKADIVRRAMSKKDFAKLHSVKQDFLSAAINNGYAQNQAEQIWKWIEDFAGYGFNKAHSISYAYIAYWLAYLKFYFPEQFYASLFNGAFGNGNKTRILINELNPYQISFSGPDIRNINTNYVSLNKRIYAPLTIIKGIGNEFLKRLKPAYLNNKPAFKDFFSAMIVLVNAGLSKAIFETLVWAGAFDSYNYQRSDLIKNMDKIFNFAEVNSKVQEVNFDRAPIIETSDKIDEKLVYEQEFEALGFYLTANPFSKLRKDLKLKTYTLSQVANNVITGKVVVNLKKIRHKKDKNNNLMAFVTISDDTEVLSATIFSSLYEEVKDNLTENNIVLATIKIDNYNNQKRAVINSIDQWLE